MIQFAYPYIAYIGIPIILIIAYWRWYYYKKPLYIYSSVLPLEHAQQVSSLWSEYLIYFLRLLALISLCIALARPRQPDEKTKLYVPGIDIMLVLDVSGSMQLFDDMHDARSRIEVARAEAIKFINKRENDAIGLVVFGNGAVSRCPVTTDKKMVQELLKDTQIGIVDPEGTTLSRALLAAINRLKNSSAKSKIIILLTDGEPTAHDSDPQISIDLAKKLGIKIYTIGVGSVKGGFFNHPYLGVVPVQSILNTKLLKEFAQATGGQFFHAHNPQDIEKIYTLIDQLEKHEQKVPLYARYCEYFMIFLWLALIAIVSEIVISYWWLSL